MRMPLFVARQWVRHRTARLNEISGRYSVMKDEFYVPSPEHILPQSSNNKQGRAGKRYDAEQEASLVERFLTGQAEAYREYGEMSHGVEECLR